MQRETQAARLIAVANMGSSTLKLALLEVGPDGIREYQRLQRAWSSSGDADELRDALASLKKAPDAFGLRIVHGGANYSDPTTLTPQVITELEALIPLAPLHNGPALAAAHEIHTGFPDLPTVAVFDTAFHAHRPDVSMRYALPREMIETFGFQRYGFHGLAHASLADGLGSALGVPSNEVSGVTLQLGSGCSACAIQHGRSVETSMGFSPLEGLVMATRSGDVDPTIVLQLVRAGRSAARIEEDLTQKAGLFALCGLTDMRDIVAAESQGVAAAKLALDLFCHRIVLTVGAYLTLLGGEGAVVFGGGIGTNSPPIRARIAEGLSAWDVRLDSERNRENRPGRISQDHSRPVFALTTNEENVIACEVLRHLGW